MGVERALDVYAQADMLNSLPYNLWNTLEESMEMLGVVVFIDTLLRMAPAVSVPSVSTRLAENQTSMPPEIPLEAHPGA